VAGVEEVHVVARVEEVHVVAGVGVVHVVAGIALGLLGLVVVVHVAVEVHVAIGGVAGLVLDEEVVHGASSTIHEQ